MATARFWRLINLRAYTGSDLELAGLHLYSGQGRVCAGATLSASIPPVAGTLDALQSESVAEAVLFSKHAIASAGFEIRWEMTAPVSVTAVRVAAAGEVQSFLQRATLQSSDDGLIWAVDRELNGFEFPGPWQWGVPVGVVITADLSNTAFLMVIPQDDVVSDGTGNFVPNMTGAVSIGVDSAHSGAAVLLSGGYVSVGGNADFVFGAAPFTLEGWFLVRGVSNGVAALFSRRLGLEQSPFELRIDASGAISAFASGGSWGTSYLTGGRITFGKLTHVAITGDGSTVTLYLDGVAVSTVTQTYMSGVPSSPLIIGKGPDGTLSGSVSNVRFSTICRYNQNFTPPVPFSKMQGLVGWPVTCAFTPSVIRITSVPLSTPRLSATSQAVFVDLQDGGTGRIYGVVQEYVSESVSRSLRRRVRLCHQKSGRLVRETWSDAASGVYVFDGLREGEHYYTLSLDHEGHYQGVLANDLLPEPM